MLLALPYTVYATSVFLAAAAVTLVLLLLAPGLSLRRKIAHGGARIGLALAGMRVRVLNGDRLPAGPCVVVANHASYIDGVVMKAALPPRFAFVIKREMDSVPLAGLLLRRIGAEFVERARTSRGARDAGHRRKQARDAVSLVFFPEGTFGADPGLLRFHAGAFVFAQRAGVPVVPVALRGTRRALPSRRGLPWPMRIDVDVQAPLRVAPREADGDGETAVHALRDRARAAILAHIDEPDAAG